MIESNSLKGLTTETKKLELANSYLDEAFKITCRKCGGKAKKSKGLVNIHNIGTNEKSKEFETKLVDCNKCVDCGHSFK